MSDQNIAVGDKVWHKGAVGAEYPQLTIKCFLFPKKTSPKELVEVTYSTELCRCTYWNPISGLFVSHDFNINELQKTKR